MSILYIYVCIDILLYMYTCAVGPTYCINRIKKKKMQLKKNLHNKGDFNVCF